VRSGPGHHTNSAACDAELDDGRLSKLRRHRPAATPPPGWGGTRILGAEDVYSSHGGAINDLTPRGFQVLKFAEDASGDGRMLVAVIEGAGEPPPGSDPPGRSPQAEGAQGKRKPHRRGPPSRAWAPTATSSSSLSGR